MFLPMYAGSHAYRCTCAQAQDVWKHTCTIKYTHTSAPDLHSVSSLHLVSSNSAVNHRKWPFHSAWTLCLLQTVTLGSQEGAFENVRMNYSGDQGQTIRQLITAHMLRRVAMCVLSSPQGKRQHLAVSHEKGKITILQLSALLKQADSSKKKLTLTVGSVCVSWEEGWEVIWGQGDGYWSLEGERVAWCGEGGGWVGGCSLELVRLWVWLWESAPPC